METKTLNIYEIAHENNVSENISASTIREAIEQSTIPEEESSVVHAIRVAKDVKTVIQDRPSVVSFVTEIDDERAEGTVSVNIATPLQGIGHSGDTVTLQAIPNKNYMFVRWELNDIEIGTAATMSFVLPDLGSNYDITDEYELGNYNRLLNKPQINGIELEGNKTTEDLQLNVSESTVGKLLQDNGSSYLEAYYDVENESYFCRNLITNALVDKELFNKERYYGKFFGGAKLSDEPLQFAPNTLNDYELCAVDYVGQMFKEASYIKFEHDKVVIFTAYDEAEEIERDYSDLVSVDFNVPVERETRNITYLDLLLDIDIAMQKKSQNNAESGRYVTAKDLMRILRLFSRGV